MRVYQAKKDQQVITNLTENEELSFEISNDEVIIDMLRRNYAFPIQTPVQEYLCNARDAMREAKKENEEFLVSLPNSLDPNFKIRDYGVGLSPERVRQVFVKYGESTKRNTNSQTGGYGIGAKSAFIYTDSFKVISYYEGIKYTYLAIRSKNQEKGSFDCIHKCETDEVNGVEIVIPVKSEDFSEFARSVYRATYFWSVRPKLVGISKFEIPKSYTNNQPILVNKYGAIYPIDSKFSFGLKEEKKDTNDWYARYNTNQFNKDIILVIDGIPYKNPFESLKDQSLVNQTKQTQVLFFNTGDISLPPNREEIISESTNEKVVKKMSEEYINSLSNEYQSLFKKSSLIEVATKIKYLQQVVTEKHLKGIIEGNYPQCKVEVITQENYYNPKTQIIVHPKSQNPLLLTGIMDTTRTGRVKTITENQNIDYINLSESCVHFVNDTEENLDKIQGKIKKYLNDSPIRGRDIIQVLDNQEDTPFATKFSDVIKKFEKVKEEPKKNYTKRTDEIVYFDISEKSLVNSYNNLTEADDDQISRTTQTLKKDDSSDISDCVFIETEQNSLYKKYNLDPVLIQNLILYILDQGVKVIAFAEKNRKYFEGGIDFKDFIKNPKLVPFKKKSKDQYLAILLQNEAQKNDDSFFGGDFKNLGSSNISEMIEKVNNKDIQYLLTLRCHVSTHYQDKPRYLTSKFLEFITTPEIKKEVSSLIKQGENFLKKNYIFHINRHSYDDNKLDYLVKYINENN